MTFKDFVQPQFKPKLKQFGSEAQRLSTEELYQVYDDLKKHFPEKTELVRSLATKPDHGDVDILIQTSDNVEKLIQSRLGDKVLKVSRNGPITSFLYSFNGKTLHIDLIQSSTDEKFISNSLYYALNDFSSIVGAFSKKLHFKFGSEGFFKRFKDKKGMWHDIFITHNLLDGMSMLGLNQNKYKDIKSPDDIVAFVSESPLFNSDMGELDAVDRQSLRMRPTMDYIMGKLRALGRKRSVEDEDYYFRALFPKKYEETEKQKQEINSKTYGLRSKYNGIWLMDKFGIKPGPELGRILKELDKIEGIDDMPENEVEGIVRGLIRV